MDALTLHPSQTLTLSTSPCRRRQRRGAGGTAVVRASGRRRDHYGEGRMVDENMIVLRLRIREMKMMERKKEEEEEGEEGIGGMMEWERKYYNGEYGGHVCEAVGLLQSYLMNVRPCVAVGMVAFVALSVFMSSGWLFFNSMDMVNTFFSFLLCLWSKF